MTKLDDLFSGQVGEFVALNQSSSYVEPMRGFVRRNHDNLLEVHTVDENEGLAAHGHVEEGRRETPKCIVGRTSSDGILLLRPSGSSRSRNYGGHRASTRTFRYRTAITGVYPSELRSENIKAVELQVSDLLHWAQMPVISIESEIRKNGATKSVTITLDGKERRDVARIYGGMRVELSPYWSYSSNDAFSRIETPLAARIVASTPKPIEEFLTPLMDLRLLFSLANRIHVPVDNARALLDYKGRGKDELEQWSPLWDQRLMGEVAKRPNGLIAAFSYQAMGGPQGVARWLKFSHEHGHFVRVVTTRPMTSGMTVTTRLMELYSAFEYYVAVGRRARRKWAPKGRIPKAQIIADLGGREFSGVVGDSHRWADVMHWMNNRAKHNPGAGEDPLAMHWMNESAEVLITIIALNHVSGRKKASRQLVSDHRVENIGREVQAVLADLPNPLPMTY